MSKMGPYTKVFNNFLKSFICSKINGSHCKDGNKKEREKKNFKNEGKCNCIQFNLYKNYTVLLPYNFSFI